MKKDFWIWLFVLIVGISCEKTPQQRNITPAFYHWQTHFELTPPENTYLQNLKVQKIYTKFFDVDWDNALQMPVPVAEISWDDPSINTLEIVPTVFITNRTLLKLDEKRVEFLGTKMIALLEALILEAPSSDIKEIQIDCDWSSQSQILYFRLLKLLKAHFNSKNITLSATIRLHQIKYATRTGVPPVDRGMLMCYNTGNIRDWATTNSIFMPTTVAQYLMGFDDYPLPLDLALPIFSWGIVFRDNQLLSIINNLEAGTIRSFPQLKQISSSRYEIVKSTYLEGYYLYKGDLIRTETVNLDSLEVLIKLLDPLWKTADFSLAFYHLDSLTIKNYPHEELENLRQEFLQ